MDPERWNALADALLAEAGDGHQTQFQEGAAEEPGAASGVGELHGHGPESIFQDGQSSPEETSLFGLFGEADALESMWADMLREVGDEREAGAEMPAGPNRGGAAATEEVPRERAASPARRGRGRPKGTCGSAGLREMLGRIEHDRAEAAAAAAPVPGSVEYARECHAGATVVASTDAACLSFSPVAVPLPGIGAQCWQILRSASISGSELHRALVAVAEVGLPQSS